MVGVEDIVVGVSQGEAVGNGRCLMAVGIASGFGAGQRFEEVPLRFGSAAWSASKKSATSYLARFGIGCGRAVGMATTAGELRAQSSEHKHKHT